MKKLILTLTALILSVIVFANDTPHIEIDGVWLEQDNVVIILYTLIDDNNCDLTLEISDDNGATWDVPVSPEALVGQLENVEPGKRHIEWHSKIDIPGTRGSYTFKITADDGHSPPGPEGIEFVTIPGGTFQMGDNFSEGSSDERPVHTVTLSAFRMSRHEVTNGQYAEFLNDAYPSTIKVVSGVVYAVSDSSNSYPYCDMHSYYSDSQIDFNSATGQFTVRTKGERNMVNDPMVEVSWYGAKAFCDYYGYRLPTEAEWEYAARGGLSGNRFPWGNTINHNDANYLADGSAYSYDTSPYTSYTCHPDWDSGGPPYTSPVGSFSANGYGLYDMAGNVWEWCNDWYGSSYYSSSPSSNPTGPTTGTYRVLRGGCWGNNAHYCRVALRGYRPPYSRNYYGFGFRISLDF